MNTVLRIPSGVCGGSTSNEIQIHVEGQCAEPIVLFRIMTIRPVHHEGSVHIVAHPEWRGGARGDEKQIHVEDSVQRTICSLVVMGIRHLYHEIDGFE